jgi:hypothetical protein
MNPTEYHAYPLDNFIISITQAVMYGQVDADLYVSAENGNNNNDGLTPGSPLKTIQYANSIILADSTNPHTIHLADGVYSPSTNDEFFPVTIIDNISLIGESREGVILDAENMTGVMHIESNSNSEIKYMTLRNGYHGQGGGIFIESSEPYLAHLTIKDNSASYGGGIYCILNSNLILFDVIISNNAAYYCGGGIAVDNNSELSIENAIINNNSATYGGGLYIRDCDDPATLTNILVTDNCSDQGGGILCYSSDLYLRNATISNNSALGNSGQGGGLCCYGFYYNSSEIDLLNCILWNNIPEEINTELSGDHVISLTIDYSDIEGGIEGIVYDENDIINWGDGCFDADPLFIGIGEHPYSLQSVSPCIDAGSIENYFLQIPASDLIGHERIWDGDNNGVAIIDLGPYEYGSPSHSDEYEIVKSDNVQIANYPNPFNPSTTISFSVPQTALFATIEIFNLKGQKVKTLECGNSFAAKARNLLSYSVTWDGTDDNNKQVSSGIYFYKLKAGNFEKTKKCLLMK